MTALYITLGVIAFLALGYVVSHICVNVAMFERFFRRDKPEKIGNLDSPAYDLHREEMLAARQRMEKMPYERVYITSFDGLKLSARHYEGTNDTLVIMCHGAHAYSLNNFGVYAEKLLKKGYSLLIIDQRAYGESEGEYTSYGLKEQYDLLEWIKFCRTYANIANIVLYGISMGAATIAYASDKIEDERVKAMIIESGYTSLYELEHSLTSARHLPDFLFTMQRWLTKKKIGVDFYASNISSLEKTTVPALFVWGNIDIVTPEGDFLDMYRHCSSEKKLISVRGAGHAVAMVAGGEKTEKQFFEFINKYTGEKK